MTGSSADLFARLVVIGAMALALGLAGCGRKGPLELPPGAADNLSPSTRTTQLNPDGTPAKPLPNQKRLAIDWLLN